ncbi:MAG TPA: UbiA family prenyltransferase [Verrucomicrobiae bacterium]|nr:UbiA family prenyltransferase [Verrucomicrobiae bacterium]
MKILIERIEKAHASFYNWIAAFFGLVLTRVLLENIANDNIRGVLLSDVQYMLHILLWYAGTYLSLVIVIYLFTFEKIEKASKYVMFVFLLIWLTAIIDLLLFQGDGQRLGYIYETPSNMFRVFLTWFSQFSPMSVGQRIVIPLVVLACGYYVHLKTKKNILTGTAALISCLALFAWGAVPSLFKWFYDLIHAYGASETRLSVVNFFIDAANNSVHRLNVILPELTYSHSYFMEYLQAVLFSKIFFLLLVILIALWGIAYDKKKFLAVVANVRLFGITHYYLNILIGLLLASSVIGINYDWVFCLSVLVMFLSCYFAYMFAMGVNDISDFEIDKVSNTERPLVQKVLTPEELKNYNLVFLLLALIGASLTGPIAFYMIVVALAVSYIYSAEPLRLKRIPFLATFLIGIATLAMMVMGFFFVNYSKSIEQFPNEIILAVLSFFTLWGNVKDIKDREGDATGGVQTLANFLDMRKSKSLIATLAVTAYMLVPLILQNRELLFFSFFAAVVTSYLIYRKNYSHYSVFMVYFTYLIFCMLIVSR